MERGISESVSFPAEAMRFACSLCVATAVLAFKLATGASSRGEQHRSTGAALLYREPAAPVTCHVSLACPPRRCRQDMAIIQTHQALLKACLFLMEKRLLCKTVLRHGGRVARNVCFPNGKTAVLRIAPFAAPLLHAKVSARAGAHGEGMLVFLSRKVAFAKNWPSTRRATKPTHRSAKHGGNLPDQTCRFPNGKSVVLNIGASVFVNAESLLLLAEKEACLHSGTGCAKAGFSEMSVFQLGK